MSLLKGAVRRGKMVPGREATIYINTLFFSVKPDMERLASVDMDLDFFPMSAPFS